MTRTGKRTALWCLLIVGILLCLAPSVGASWVTYRLVLKPALASGGRERPPNQAELRVAIAHDPVMLTTQFVIAPIGVLLVVASLIMLRRLKQLPPPPLPSDYGIGR